MDGVDGVDGVDGWMKKEKEKDGCICTREIDTSV